MSERRAIHYTIAAAQPQAHLFDVTCQVDAPDPTGQRFFMPAWIPGSYLVRNYARHVMDFEASADGKPVASHKLDKSTWRCAPCTGPLTVRYRVFAWDPSVRGSHLDSRHGFFNGVCVFMEVHGQEHQPVSVDIEPPAGATASWRVATSMPTAGADDWGFGRYQAADYDELIDHPVEMGVVDVIDYQVAEVPHYVVLRGRHACNGERLARDLTRVCAEQVALFGELPAMDRYVFLTNVLGKGYGGLEHRASSALVCSRHELPGAGSVISKDYRRLLGLISHEYFHLWNIKRIRPAAFTPYGLADESHTELLWVFEGITSYYDDLALLRSGVIDLASYLELVSDTVARVMSVPSYRRQSLAESSFDAWTKFYQPTENSDNAVVSYYAKGALAALTLDIVIRERSADQHSLDDVMRAMWATYGRPGKGVPEDGFEDLCEQVTGLELSDFFAQVVRGTGDMELELRLESLGIRLVERPDEQMRVALGFKLEKDGLQVGSVSNDSPAEKAGLAPGDQLVALGGLQVTPQSWPQLTAAYAPGDTAVLHVFRNDELLALDIRFGEPQARKWTLRIDDDASGSQVERRERWLASSQDAR